MTTVRLNGTGYHVLHNHLDVGDPVREKILEHGIMDPIDFDADELEHLVDAVDELGRKGPTSWQNTRMRVRRAAREAGVDLTTGGASAGASA